MHKLVVNPFKSNTMLSRQRINESTINITINATPVVASETFKLLSITYDSRLGVNLFMYLTLCSFLLRSIFIKLYMLRTIVDL